MPAKNINTEILIIGGGLAGVCISYALRAAGRKVILIEKGKIGAGATKSTTAFITKAIDTSLSDLVSMLGSRNAKLVWDSGQTAIDWIEKIIKKEKISADFKRVSAFIYASTKKQLDDLIKEEEAAEKLGFKVALRSDGNLNFPNFGYLEVKNQAKFSASKFITQLAKSARKAGVRIMEKSEAKNIDSDKMTVKTDSRSIKAEKIVVATYEPFNKPDVLFIRKAMYVSYCISAEIPKGILKEAIYFDLSNPYYYFRIDPQDAKTDVITLGGADHRAGIKLKKEKSFASLETHLNKILSGLKYKITDRWTGPILESSDGIPLIGEYRPNQYVVTAFSGNGMTYSMISAILIRDLVMRRKNDWGRLYDPRRPRYLKRYVKKAIDYGKEFVGGAAKNSLKLRRKRQKK